MLNEQISVIPAHIENNRLQTKQVWIRRNNRDTSPPSIACILDNLSMASYAPEADFHPLTMEKWQDELEEAQPDLLFVESAWRGHEGSWWNAVQRRGRELTSIVEWCNSREIPTVFWNKEDPVHFSTFLDTARIFDVVFTTDVDCVPRYRAALKHERVFFLPFAAQPRYHNPLEEFNRVDGCSFAGAYYQKYADRNRDFAELVPVLHDYGVFDIYDRNFGAENESQRFPEEFRDHVVGHLLPEDIGVAYKGYTYSLNLNSVKQSQSMFARRVFELLASNTGVISNYSRGLKLLFGDLTVATDGSQRLRERLAEIERAPNGTDRLRHLGVRKIFREHTYRHRLTEILARAGVTVPPPNDDSVLLLGFVSNLEQARRVAHSVENQIHDNINLLLVNSASEVAPSLPEWIEVADNVEEAESMIRERSFQYIGFIDPDSWYGPEYVRDMLDVFTWAKVSRVGHAERYCWSGRGMLRLEEGASWTIKADVPFTCSLMEANAETFLAKHRLNPDLKTQVLSVSTLEYCENGFLAPTSELEHVMTPLVDEGASLTEIQQYAQSLDPAAEILPDSPLSLLRPTELLGDRGEGDGVIYRANTLGELEIESTLPDDKHEYVYNDQLLTPFMLPENQGDEVYLGSTPGLNVMLALLYFDENNQRVGHTTLFTGRNNPLVWPENTAKVRVGLRVRGSGSTILSLYSRTKRNSAVHPPLLGKRNLVVTNIYPSYDSLYKNAFIASRLRRYRGETFTTNVFCVNNNSFELSYREFEGTDVFSGNGEILKRIATSGQLDRVLVHFLSQEMWDAFRDVAIPGGVTVWIHGFEAQPWWRRKVVYDDANKRERAVEESKERMSFWRQVLQNVPPQWHFVFVSDWLARTFFEDVGISLPREQYSVIHNIVDTNRFSFREKPAEQRFRVLSIRPYASKIYANDLSVATVLDLQRRSSNFSDFDFHFYGDGPLFDETMAPLRDIPNVQIHRGFLTQTEIAEVHKDFGVFLVPSRMDTQGVSRGEAMASGLVPVTTDVAAIPEFVDAESGIVVPPEDPVALAKAMQTIADNPDLFAKLSRGAAHRVNSQLTFDRTIRKELELIQRNTLRSETLGSVISDETPMCSTLMDELTN